MANTCYMNSVLQSIFYVPDYRDQVLNTTFVHSSVGQQVASLFQHMCKGAGAGAVDPAHLARVLGLNVATQEDAQEFMLRLLHDIDDSILLVAEQTPRQVLPSHVFQGRTEQTIRCIHVDFTKSRTQRFLDLTVDMAGFDRLEDALVDMFTRPDLLMGENRYRAAEPHGLQDAEKRLHLTDLPKVLCITLKRFSYDTNTNALKKLGDRLEFPLSLDMARVHSHAGAAAEEDAAISSGNYDLSSVIVHEGTASFGHYTCYARPDPRTKPNCWLLLNDDMVSQVPHDVVCRAAYGSERGSGSSSSAYMLFYTKR